MADTEKKLRDTLDKILDDKGLRPREIEVKAIVTGGAHTSALFTVNVSSPGRDDLKLFAKVASNVEMRRARMTADCMYKTEIQVYTRVVKIYEDIQAERDIPEEHRFVFPQFYGCNENYGEETIVIENLNEAGFKSYDRFKSIDWDYACVSVENLAKFHALSFAFEKYRPEEFRMMIPDMKHEMGKTNNENIEEGMIAMYRKMVENTVAVVGEDYRDRTRDFILQHNLWDTFYKPIGKPVIAHGDYRTSNLLFRTQGDSLQAIAVDYQTVHAGCPASDLIFFIFLGSDEEFRWQHYEKLLDHYFASLQQALERLAVEPGVYSREKFDSDMKEFITLSESEYERLPRLFELENYERCMEAPGGVYCVANLELYTDRSSDLYTLIQEYSAFTLKHYNYSKIDRGVCVTQTCESHARRAGLDINRDLGALLEGCLNETVHNKYGLMARVYNMNCVKENNKDQLNLDYFDYTFLGIFIILLVLCLVGSCCEITSNDRNNEQNCKKRLSGKDLLLCFSVPRNYKSLTTIEESDPRVNVFKSIHAFRTIITFFTVNTHVEFIITNGFNADPHSIEKAYESVVTRILYSGTNIVQVFFFVTGMLLTYFMQVSAETSAMSWKLVPKIIFLRWLRLTPPAVTLVAFSASWMRRLGSGPLWRTYITDGSSAQCRRYFWAHVLYFNNYIPQDVLCVLPTWYIAADMQLFIVGVVVHFALRNRSRRCQVTALALLLLLAMAGPALHVWWQDLDAFLLQTPESYRTLACENLRKLHILGHNNLSCFILGLAAGYLVYYLQQNKVEYPNFKIGNFISWCIIPMYILLMYCGSLFYYDGERPPLAIRMLYAGTNRAIVGFIAVFWMVGVTLKFNGMSKALMEWRGWVLPSRLTYSVYLLHNIFVELGLGLKSQLVPVSFFNMFLLSVGVFVVTFVLAVPFHLLVEAPAVKLIKLTAKGKTEKKLN